MMVFGKKGPANVIGSTVHLLCALTEAGRQWVERYVHYESHQQISDGIAVAARYIVPIVEGMKAAGLQLGKDFEVIVG
ncbi:unnamed protein product [marine sediment metagenome]|uniref:Uncharacterized protein n=1 Tax=marine sediment metagenome TaxID=412755 RepID=X0RJ99_9ZZZZ